MERCDIPTTRLQWSPKALILHGMTAFRKKQAQIAELQEFYGTFFIILEICQYPIFCSLLIPLADFHLNVFL